MPDTVTMQRLFGRGGAIAPTKSTHAQMMEHEKAGRLMREAQPKTNSTFQWRTLAKFTGDEAADGQETEPISFAHLKFTTEPFMTTGCKLCRQSDGEYYPCPGMAAVREWQMDDTGKYTGATLNLFAYGDVPADYQVVIYAVFTGPAIRTGEPQQE